MISTEAVLDKFSDRHINMVVNRLVGRVGFTDADRDDLRQSFRLKLIERMPDYDPNRKWEAFVVMVCKNHRASLLQHRLAEMRSPLRETSVSTDASCDRRLPPQRTDQWELSEDTNSVLADMPPMMRKACEILMRNPKRRVASELGISQGSAYGIIDRALARFEKAHMRDYL